MRSRIRSVLIPVGSAAAVALLWLVVTATAGQAPTAARFPSYRAPRLAGHSDLNGVWQAFVTANWNIQDHDAQPGVHPELMGAYGAGPAGQSVVEGGEIPYQPWALAKKKENYERRATLDPETRCYLPGVPRIMYMPFPFQIIQKPNELTLLYEYVHAVRYIFTSGSHPQGPIEWWLGDSRARWEG